MERASGHRILDRHIHENRSAAARVELDRYQAGFSRQAARYLRVAAGCAQRGLDPNRRVQLTSQLHRDRDPLSKQRPGRRQDLGDARLRWLAPHRDPLQRQPGLSHRTQRTRRITHVLQAIRDDHDAGDGRLRVYCQGRIQRHLDVRHRRLEIGHCIVGLRHGNSRTARELEQLNFASAACPGCLHDFGDGLVGGCARHALGAIDQQQHARPAARIEPRGPEQGQGQRHQGGQLQGQRDRSPEAGAGHSNATPVLPFNRIPCRHSETISHSSTSTAAASSGHAPSR